MLACKEFDLHDRHKGFKQGDKERSTQKGCWFLVNERRTQFSPLLILFQDHVGPA